MTTFRAFTSVLILAAVVSGPAHAEMASGSKPTAKTAEAKSKRDAKTAHADKKKHIAAEKKSLHGESNKTSKERGNGRHVAAKASHGEAKKEKKHEHAP